MKKLLLKFGFVPRSILDNVSKELSSALAVNVQLREQAENREERIEQLISDCTRHREAHDRLKEKHEQQQRAAGISARALSGLAPINRFRK